MRKTKKIDNAKTKEKCSEKKELREREIKKKGRKVI